MDAPRKLVIAVEWVGENGLEPSDLALIIEYASPLGFVNAYVWDEDAFVEDVNDEGWDEDDNASGPVRRVLKRARVT